MGRKTYRWTSTQKSAVVAALQVNKKAGHANPGVRRIQSELVDRSTGEWRCTVHGTPAGFEFCSRFARAAGKPDEGAEAAELIAGLR